jgi:hypothetical protein
MTSSINSLNSLITSNNSQTSQSSSNQALSPEQLIAQLLAQQTNSGSSYGPSYLLNLSATGAAYANSANSQSSGSQQDFWTDFQQLGQALQTNNLSAAQQAFASLSQLPGVQSAIQNNPNSPITQELSQIGSALQSGNLGSAQQAFATLQQQIASAATSSNVPKVGGHHHHHHGGGNNQASSTASTSTSDSSSTGNLLASIDSLLSTIETDSTGSGNTNDTGTTGTTPNVNITT